MKRFLCLMAMMGVLTASAQKLRLDSALAARYYRMGNIDTAYISRPKTKWTVTARINVSGSQIKMEHLRQYQIASYEYCSPHIGLCLVIIQCVKSYCCFHTINYKL